MEFMEPIPTYSIAKLAKIPTDSMEKLEKLPRLFENFVCNFYSRLAPHHEGAGVQPFDLPPRLAHGVNLGSTSKNSYEHAHVRVSSEAHTQQGNSNSHERLRILSS